MKKNNMHHSIFSILYPIGLLCCLFSLTQCHNINDRFDYKSNSEIQPSTIVEGKQKGAHVFGVGEATNLDFLKQQNIEWVTLVSWGWQEKYDSPMVQHHRGDSLRIRRRDSSWMKRIEFVRSAGFKVFVKPHVWIDSPADGKWRSDIFPKNDENWELWKQSYREFILRYATIAQQGKAEMFCLGTEFSRLSVEKPVFWKNLLKEVRSVYSGKITYAANWYKEYEKITFWDELDYIGIQAYFPLVNNKNPSVEQISKGWNKHIPTIKSIHKKYNRNILFTELGYKSTANSAIKPWEWIENSPKNHNALSLETQANCYEAFFNTIWKKKWFAGVHIWQLRSNDIRHRREENLDFTPQGKPAESIITNGFE